MSLGVGEGEAITSIHRASRTITFRENPGDFRSILIDAFSIPEGLDDRELIAALIITDPWYAHTYAEPTSGSPRGSRSTRPP